MCGALSGVRNARAGATLALRAWFSMMPLPFWSVTVALIAFCAMVSALASSCWNDVVVLLATATGEPMSAAVCSSSRRWPAGAGPTAVMPVSCTRPAAALEMGPKQANMETHDSAACTAGSAHAGKYTWLPTVNGTLVAGDSGV